MTSRLANTVEITKIRRRLETVLAENRTLRSTLTKKQFEKSNDQQDSLYYLLQEFISENNRLKETNRDLRDKAKAESKITMTKLPNVITVSPDALDRQRNDSKSSTRTQFSTVSTQTEPRARKNRRYMSFVLKLPLSIFVLSLNNSTSSSAKSQTSFQRRKLGYTDLYTRRKDFAGNNRVSMESISSIISDQKDSVFIQKDKTSQNSPPKTDKAAPPPKLEKRILREKLFQKSNINDKRNTGREKRLKTNRPTVNDRKGRFKQSTVFDVEPRMPKRSKPTDFFPPGYIK